MKITQQKVWMALSAVLVLAVLTVSCGDDAADAAEVLDELVALEKSALDPYYTVADPQVYVDQFAGDRTYFDPWSAGKIEGEAVSQHLLSFTGLIPESNYEIVNPAVALHGDAAVFTFQVETYDPASNQLTSSWNATEVRSFIDGRWMMVHAHWSPIESVGTEAG